MEKSILFNKIFRKINEFYKTDTEIELNYVTIFKVENSIERFAKKLIQFLLNNNLVILKSKSASSLRHYFPKNLDNKNDFLSLLQECFRFINIKINKPKKNLEEYDPSYFFISDYNSIIRILLYWDWSWFPFPEEKIDDMKKLFKKFDIYVYFEKKFIDQIFGENGILKRYKLSVPKFLESLAIRERYSRQLVYRWKQKKYFPVSFLDIIINSRFDFDKNYYNYIKSIKIGKSSEKIDKQLLDLIKKNYEKIFIKFIPPPPKSLLGYLFKSEKEIETYEIDIFKRYRQFLATLKDEFAELKNFEDIIDEIKEKLQKPNDLIFLKSLKLENFKSYKEQYFEFQKGINIIYGLNSSGKTTIFEAILFALFLLNPTRKLIFHEKEKKSQEYFIKHIINSNTNLIQAGKNNCRVELKLKSRNSEIMIIREINIKGEQRITFNDGTHLKKFEFKTLIFPVYPFELPFDEYFENQKKYEDDRKTNLKIKNLYREFGCSFEKESVFSSLFLEYNFLWNIEEYEISELRNFYLKKFNLNFLNLMIDEFENFLKFMLEQRRKLILKILDRLSPYKLYNEINNIGFYKFINTGSDKCDSCGELIHPDVPPYNKPGGFCRSCNKKYCDQCLEILNFSCPECNNKIQYENYERREYDPIDFYPLLGEMPEYGWAYEIESIFKAIHYKDYENKDYLKDLNIKINSETIERLELCMNNPYLDNIFYLLRVYISYSRNKNYSFDQDFFKFGINEKEISNFNKRSNKFLYFKIFNYFALMLILYLTKIRRKILDKNKDSTEIEIYKIFIKLHREIKPLILQNDFEVDLFQNIFPFELKLLEFFYIIFILIQSPILSEKIREIKNKHLDEATIEKLIKIFQYFSNIGKREKLRQHNLDYPIIFSILNTEIKLEQKSIKIMGIRDNIVINFSDYNLEEIHGLDYKIFKAQLKNQLKILKEIQKKYTKIEEIDLSHNKIDQKLKFLEKSINFLYNLNLENLAKKYENFYLDIFKKHNFTTFLDKLGIPKIKFNESNKSYLISNLSGGEKSKLILCLLSILISISNRNAFYLIDEPNELLDPENIDVMKEYFFKLFNNRQVIINTFIDKYLNFQPALIYEVLKDRNNDSHGFQLPRESEAFEFFMKQEKELKVIDNNIEKEPSNPKLWDQKIRILYKYRRYKEALEAVSTFLELFPKDKRFLGDKQSLSSLTGKYEDSLHILKQQIKFGDVYPGIYNNKAQDELSLGRYDEALESVEKAIDLNSQDSFSYKFKAQILVELERYDEALSEFNKGFEIQKDEMIDTGIKQSILKKKALFLAKSEKKEEAIEVILEAISNEPDWAEMYEVYGDILILFEDYDDAIIQLEKAKKLPFYSERLYIKLGICYMKLSQYNKALKMFEKAKAIAFHDYQGVITMSQGRIIPHPEPQREIIEEAEKFIAEIKNHNKK